MESLNPFSCFSFFCTLRPPGRLKIWRSQLAAIRKGSPAMQLGLQYVAFTICASVSFAAQLAAQRAAQASAQLTVVDAIVLFLLVCLRSFLLVQHMRW